MPASAAQYLFAARRQKGIWKAKLNSRLPSTSGPTPVRSPTRTPAHAVVFGLLPYKYRRLFEWRQRIARATQDRQRLTHPPIQPRKHSTGLGVVVVVVIVLVVPHTAETQGQSRVIQALIFLGGSARRAPLRRTSGRTLARSLTLARCGPTEAVHFEGRRPRSSSILQPFSDKSAVPRHGGSTVVLI